MNAEVRQRGASFRPRWLRWPAAIAFVIGWPAAHLLLAQAPAAAPASDDWHQRPAASSGIEVGKKIPDFKLRDQNGKLQTFQTIRGPKGAAIYFVRSADW